MSADRIVINTGPLIALALIDAIDIPGMLPYEFCCPFEVRCELDQGESLGTQEYRPNGFTLYHLRTQCPNSHRSP